MACWLVGDWKELSRWRLALSLGAFLAVVVTIATLYKWVTVVFAEINPVAVVAAVGVAVAGFVWFRKSVKNDSVPMFKKRLLEEENEKSEREQ